MGKYFGNVIFVTPLTSWFTMITLGAAHSHWSFFPALGYWETFIVILVVSILSFHDSNNNDDSSLDFWLAPLRSWFVMLIIGALNHHGVDVPALGYWQVLFFSLPAIFFFIISTLTITLFIAPLAASRN